MKRGGGKSFSRAEGGGGGGAQTVLGYIFFMQQLEVLAKLKGGGMEKVSTL